MTELALITKPCGVCHVPVEDVDDPNFKEPWLCYWCHCQKEGRNLKETFNGLGQMTKRLMRVATKHNPKPPTPEKAAEYKKRMEAIDPVTALANVLEALKPQLNPDCLEAAGKAWDAWDAERDPFEKVLLQMELGLHVAGLMEHIEALGIEELERLTKETS